MKGCRPLTPAEVSAVLDSFDDDPASLRNQALFVTGLNTGLRVSELLSIPWTDLANPTQIYTSVYIRRKAMKGQLEGRSVRLNIKAREALGAWQASSRTWKVEPATAVFCSRKLAPISRMHAWRILDRTFAHIGMTGKLGTHCMRKTFADRMYQLLGGDLKQLQGALGHKWITSTSQYLSFREDEINSAIDAL